MGDAMESHSQFMSISPPAELKSDPWPALYLLNCRSSYSDTWQVQLSLNATY